MSAPLKDKKGILERLIKGRIRAKAIEAEFQEEKVPEHIASFWEASLQLSLLGSLLTLIFQHLNLSFEKLFIAFSGLAFGFLIWKGGRVAFLSWNRLLKLHKTIEDERWEIEHRRESERKELETLYSAKGFSDDLLKEVVDTLMSDDNRLLQVMLEEEMGLLLESYVHPLKKGFLAMLGVLSAYLVSACFLFFTPSALATFCPPLLFALMSNFVSYRYEKIDFLYNLIWLWAIIIFTLVASYFLIDIIP
jgi:vacuolar iron transporter family protein